MPGFVICLRHIGSITETIEKNPQNKKWEIIGLAKAETLYAPSRVKEQVEPQIRTGVYQCCVRK